MKVSNCFLQAVAPSGNGRAPDAIANVNACERETKPHIEATGADGAETGTGSQQDEVRPPKSGLQRRKRRLHRFGIISLNCLLKKRRMAIVIMKMAMTALWIVMMVTTLWT